MRCIICQLPLRLNWGICGQCYHYLPKLISVCYRCGLPLFPVTKPCHHCDKLKPNWDNLIAVADFVPPFTKLIYRFKLNNHPELAHPLARMMMLAWLAARNETGLRKPDIITCIPLHQRRYWSRGYNQSELLAKIFSHWLNKHFQPYLIKRQKQTNDQKTLSKQQRKDNIVNVFSCQTSLQGKSIAIIDDIVTTGHTIRAASKVLRQQGVQHIQIICLCRTSL